MKPKLLLKAPVTTCSGYGHHSRQLMQSLLSSDKFDVSLIPINWGHTSFIYDEKLINTCRELSLKYEKNKQLGVQYDLSIQVTIPNEFERLAKFNIGFTAGIEVDRVSHVWINKVNEIVDFVLVPSKHSAETFANTRYEKDGKVFGLQKQVFIAPEGVDTKIFRPYKVSDSKFDFDTDFNFLCVGLGLDKPLGEDRKNISSLIKWFCEKFKDNKEVGLVLKIGVVNNSEVDFDITQKRILELKQSVGCKEFPKIHLVHGRLSDEEMSELYNNPKIKAFISLTHGEGFGLPLLEAAACDLPVMAVDWSGHKDFLYVNDKKRFIALEFELKEIPGSAVWDGVMEKGSLWAYPKEEDVKDKMMKIFRSYDTPKAWAKELGISVRERYSLTKTNEYFSNFIDEAYKQLSRMTVEKTATDIVQEIKSNLGVGDSKTLLYTMPMSAGDVYISTAVVDSLKKKFPEHLIYFATNKQYVDILKENQDIHRVIQWENWMADVPFCEKIFNEVYTPNLSVQLNTSNWVHGGKGRKLAHELAAQCNVELGDYKIKLEPIEVLGHIGCDDVHRHDFILFNPGSGKGQWEARNYLHWQEVVNNLKLMIGIPIVQTGLGDEPLYEGVVDFRGKTNYNQLAHMISESCLVLGMDSVTSHLAAGLNVLQVSLYGSSYANSTGPVYNGCENNKDPELQKMYEMMKKTGDLKAEYILLETENRLGCEKACYKYQCEKDKESPCINEISPRKVVKAAVELVIGKTDAFDEAAYQEFSPKIVGYTTILNGEEHQFPYIESISSMLGFCDEVVVLDGCSTDGTYEKLIKFRDNHMLNDSMSVPRLIVEQHKWDWEVPGMDGAQKAYARDLCQVQDGIDFLWQQDCDEVVHEDDYDKIKKLVKKFPKDVDLMHLPIVELWSNKGSVRSDRHSWKWRLSRANWKITHGIAKHAQNLDTKTGKMYAKKNMSDGCEYIGCIDKEYIPHKGFYNNELEKLRVMDPEKYGVKMNEIFDRLPSVYHFSWFDLERKIRNFKSFWNKCWSNLFHDEKPEDRFPNVNTDDEIAIKAKQLELQGGEHNQSYTFKLNKSLPKIVEEWIK